MKEVEVSIILVNYNTKLLTLECIDSIYSHVNDVSFEVIVVDNASTDGSKDVLGKDSRIIYIYNDSNLGFGRANNVGALKANGDYLFFLNTDTLMTDDVIHGMWRYMKQNPSVGVCGVNLVDEEMNPTVSFERLYPSCGYLLNEITARIPARFMYGRNAYYNHTKHPLKVAYVSGADLMIRRDVFERVGGFDKGFFMYFEETDLCFQVKSLGFFVISLPDYQIIHFGGRSFSNTNAALPSFEKLKIQHESAKYYINKNLSKFNIKIYNVLYSLLINLRRAVYSISGSKDVLEMWNNVKQIVDEK